MEIRRAMCADIKCVREGQREIEIDIHRERIQGAAAVNASASDHTN